MLRALACALLGLVAVRGEHWAVLIAGSNGFFNYRHQADVCHAYHVLIDRGFHPDKIITMMYDDVANSDSNPFPGKLFNYPWKSMSEAVDVYKGCKIDYRGKHVTAKMFTAVLLGQSDKAGGRVLQSKSEDHVFVNFVDHGGVGIIAFPGSEPVMHSKELIRTLKGMHQKGMYKQLVFYLETCESGSMFQGILPASLPVYALTAANAKESSWGTYCDKNDTVAGKHVGSCLGDLFSVNWMMDSSRYMKTNETLEQQFKRVKKMTNKSHVMQYGQVKLFDKEFVSDFQSEDEALEEATTDSVAAALGEQALRHDSAVNARDVKLVQLYRNYIEERTIEAGELLIAEIKDRNDVKALGESLAKQVTGGTELKEGPLAEGAVFSWTEPLADCHERVVESFGDACGWSENRLVLARALFQLCSHTAGDAAPILAAVNRACGAPTAPEIYA